MRIASRKCFSLFYQFYYNYYTYETCKYCVLYQRKKLLYKYIDFTVEVYEEVSANTWGGTADVRTKLDGCGFSGKEVAVFNFFSTSYVFKPLQKQLAHKCSRCLCYHLH